MRSWNPRWLIVVGVFLMIVGVILPLLMVVKIVESTFLLNFLSYIASFGGLMMGLVGLAMHTVRSRKK